MLSCPGCISMVTAGWDVLTPTQNTKTVSHKHSRVRSSWQRSSLFAKSLIFSTQTWWEKNVSDVSRYRSAVLLSAWGRRGRTGHPPRRLSRVAWAVGEETGCWSGRGGNRRCCGLPAWAKWSAAGQEMEICCRKRRGQWMSAAAWYQMAERTGNQECKRDEKCKYLIIFSTRSHVWIVVCF